MTAETLLQVQAAVYTRVSGDSGITSLLAQAGAVYDHVPAAAAFPYIVIADMAALPMETQQFSGSTVTMAIETYSRAAGKAEAQRIAAALDTALHHAAFTITGHHLVSCRITATQIAQVFDATTWQCRQIVEIVTEPAGS